MYTYINITNIFIMFYLCQAGDRVRAIKCLVRGGDTKAVIQFATISRNNEIFTLAANYLQQMNWRDSVDIMKAIVMFYSKAKAFEQLATFYDSCAQVSLQLCYRLII